MTATATNEPVLVYGATGVQGGAMLERLLGSGYAVRAQTSSEEHADALEDRGREVALATLDDPDALRTASEGAAAVVLTLPQGYPSDAVRRFGRNAIDAAEAADVDLLVFNTSTRIPDEETGIAAFEDKRILERYLADSDVPFVSLRPTLYMENFALPGARRASSKTTSLPIRHRRTYGLAGSVPRTWVPSLPKRSPTPSGPRTSDASTSAGRTSSTEPPSPSASQRRWVGQWSTSRCPSTPSKPNSPRRWGRKRAR